jgi:tetratricopeptide (TPR) repeat protein|nr:tetratricopeptide repeat protein [Candidatus Krumholzibacteria bacterium]
MHLRKSDRDGNSPTASWQWGFVFLVGMVVLIALSGCTPARTITGGSADPTNPANWLDQAEARQRQGDYLGTVGALENAAAAIRSLPENVPSEEKREAQRRTALLRAWLHYDRAEYREAMRWVRAGDTASPGDIQIRRIKGLVAGSLGNRSQAHEVAGDMIRTDRSDPDADWVLAVLDRAQGRYREAFNFIASLRPDHERSAACFRDKGLIAEHLQEWAYARRWYAEAASSQPGNATLLRLDHPRLEPGPADSDQPIWLADDRYFVTGSLSAYAALALNRFDQSSDPVIHEFWAGQVVDAAGILLRMDMDRAWSLRARGLVFGDKEMTRRALKDLRKAKNLLGGQPRQDGRIEAMIGHLHLVQEQPEEALGPLREAVDLNPENATAWSDLGLCHIMDGQRDLAADALTRALELDPLLATAWYNRGLMNLHAGDLDQAESDLEEAARLTPDNTDVARLLQQVHLRRRQK